MKSEEALAELLLNEPEIRAWLGLDGTHAGTEWHRDTSRRPTAAHAAVRREAAPRKYGWPH